MSSLVQIVGSRTVKVDELPEVSLLDACRLTSEPGGDPQPVWLLSTPSGPEPVWVPPNRGSSDSREALLLEAEDTPNWELTLTFWNRYGGPDPVETGAVLEYLEVGPRRLHRLLELLDLPNADEVLDAYRTFPELPSSLRESLREEDLSPRLFRYLQRVPEDLEADLVELLEADSRVLSVQDMRRLAETLRRLSPENYDDFRENLEEPDEDRSPRTVGEELLECAWRLAFPEVAERKENYERDLGELELDGRIDVRAPKNFEGDYIDISLRCRRDEDLEKLAEEVKKCQRLLDHV